MPTKLNLRLPDRPILESEFSNVSGHLSLIQKGDHRYLRLKDCFDRRYFGPLTEEEQQAFKLLSEVSKNKLAGVL